MNEERLHELEREVLRRKAVQSFPHFLDYTDPNYSRQWFHTLIAEKCQDLLLGRLATDRLMVFVPPQHGKSEIVSRKFPAWALGYNPKLKIVGTSYAANLAQGFSRSIQRTIDSPEYKEVFPCTFLNSQILLSAKLQNATISLSAMPINRRCGLRFGKVSPPFRLSFIGCPLKRENGRQEMWLNGCFKPLRALEYGEFY